MRAGHPVYEKLRREWAADAEREERETARRDGKRNEAFLQKLSRRIGQLRQEAVDVGAMALDADGRGRWIDPEMRDDALQGDDGEAGED